MAVLKDRIAMNPTTDLSRAFLASALGHLGRSKRRARSGASSRRSILDTLVDHFGRLPFREPADAEKFTDGLRKADLAK